MSLATMGLAEELREAKVAVNSLWPRTLIATAAVKWLMGEPGMEISRTPAIMADAAFEILASDPTQLTGQWLLDENLLRERGCTDFEKYSVVPGTTPALDLYVED
jgi:citronellol/citronellal dehydrogenase